MAFLLLSSVLLLLNSLPLHAITFIPLIKLGTAMLFQTNHSKSYAPTSLQHFLGNHPLVCQAYLFTSHSHLDSSTSLDTCIHQSVVYLILSVSKLNFSHPLIYSQSLTLLFSLHNVPTKSLHTHLQCPTNFETHLLIHS